MHDFWDSKTLNQSWKFFVSQQCAIESNWLKECNTGDHRELSYSIDLLHQTGDGKLWINGIIFNVLLARLEDFERDNLIDCRMRSSGPFMDSDLWGPIDCRNSRSWRLIFLSLAHFGLTEEGNSFFAVRLRLIFFENKHCELWVPKLYAPADLPS